MRCSTCVYLFRNAIVYPKFDYLTLKQPVRLQAYVRSLRMPMYSQVSCLVFILICLKIRSRETSWSCSRGCNTKRSHRYGPTCRCSRCTDRVVLHLPCRTSLELAMFVFTRNSSRLSEPKERQKTEQTPFSYRFSFPTETVEKLSCS